jgi:glycerophosphoryl diester phosphodiesterase
MSEPLSIFTVFRSAWRDFVRTWPALVAFEAGFKLLEAWLLAPATAMLLAAAMFVSGNVALANRQVIQFLVTPTGILYAVLFVVISVALLLVEQACVMHIAAPRRVNTPIPLLKLLPAAIAATRRIARLGAVQAGLLAVALLPFALAAIGTYWLLLTEYDIYFYWKTRPASFWWAVGVGGVILGGAMVLGAALYVRWSLALPIVLFERLPAAAALRESAVRVRGHAWRVAATLIGWQAMTLIIGLTVTGGFRWLAAAWLPVVGTVANWLIIVLLLINAALLTAWSFVAAVGQGLLTRQLYMAINGDSKTTSAFSSPSPCPLPEGEDSADAVTNDASPWQRRGLALAAVLAIAAPLAIWADVSRNLFEAPSVQITAHRGHARRAPENTLSALRKAIESGADFAEIDVQQTSDGVVVLLHDSDLRRVAGDSRRLADVTFDELRKLDVGSWFSPQFAGEQVPTLAEAMQLVRGKMKLNIELKYYGPNPALAPAVAKLVREQQFKDQCVATSFEYDALLQAREACPDLRTGLIIAQSLGEISRLQVQLLSVRADHITDNTLRRAHLNQQEVHAWTVNDPRQMLHLMQRGVDNIMSSDPDLAIQVRNEWADKPYAERLLTSARLWLGLSP